MPVVLLLPVLFAVGACICFVLAQMIVRGQFSNAAEAVPVIGGFLARGVVAIERGFISLFKNYVWHSTVMLVHWITGLATNIADFPREVRVLAASLPDTFDHLLNVAVHDVVKAFVNPVRDLARAAQATADNAASDLSELAHGIAGRISRAVDAGVAGVWPGVHDIVHATATNLEHELTGYADAAAGQAVAAAGAVAGDLRGLERDLGDLVNPRTAAEVVAGVAGLAGIYALVETQVLPLVHDLTECAPKLRATCQTDFSEWLGMLEGLALLGGIPSLLELARAAQGAVADFTDDAANLVGIGGAANVPSHPSGWS